ncbi:MarR family winged helix-turn-helix transcriptional regulator [Paenibacillus sepulcri]|uniref:MarR family transcriptional regulator n=1 Tax=Paenibacillus sepulcri TaxID=359917 RepID=A0ABS7BZY9_9BACL|nr:MarR family transcriptional regulator [Paenibacillus sepulcri]
MWAIMKEQRQKDFLSLENAFIQMKRRMDSEWTKTSNFGLNAMQARILIRLDEDGSQKASALAEQLLITAGAITGIADKLIDMEYLERVRDLEDRRVVYLVITDKGKDVVQKLKDKRAEISEMMFTGLSQDDVRELTRLFNQVIANMDKARERE